MGYSIKFYLRGGKKKHKFIVLRVRNVLTNVDYRKTTSIKVDPANFNFKNQELKVDDPNYSRFIDIKSNIPKVIEGLYFGEFAAETALNKLLRIEDVREADCEVWKNYLIWTNNSKSTISQRKNYINWIEKNTPYSPLTKRHLVDIAIVKKIAKAIKENPKNSINGADNMMGKIDDIANTAFGSLKRGEAKFRPFSDNGCRLKTSAPDPVFTTPLDFKNGIDNIRTGQDFEATLAWLLSYCLCIDGIDLSVISSDFVESIKPFVEDESGKFVNINLVEKQNDFASEWAYELNRHLGMRRGKEKQNTSTVQFNIYPIPRIFQLLKSSIAKYRPEYSYNGKDPLKLYNFNTEKEEDKIKWAKVRNIYTNKLKRMSGSCMKSTRSTFSTNITEVGAPSELAKAFLKHTFKISTFEKHYLKHPQEKRNLLQKAAMDAFDIIGVWYLLLAKGVEKGFIDIDFISDFDKKMCEKGKLLDKSWIEEWEELKKENKQWADVISFGQTKSAKDILGF